MTPEITKTLGSLRHQCEIAAKHCRKVATWKYLQYVFLIVKQCGIERYKDFLITSSAVPNFATGFLWYSQGTIFRPGQLSSIVVVKRVEGPVFNSKDAAEQHGLESCKDWIDKRPAS
jgi:hypothetical protein